jgi:hypothetical protein
MTKATHHHRHHQNNRLRQIDEARLLAHVADCQEEVDKLNAKIHELIRIVASDPEAYKKIRRLQLAREILEEQKTQMIAILRESPSSSSSS